MKTCRILYLAFVLFLAVSCSENRAEEVSNESENLELTNLQFDENFKNFSVGVSLKTPLLPQQIIQKDKLDLIVTEYDEDMNKITESAQPIFINAKNLRSEKIKNLGLKGLVLVDLTLEDYQIEKQKNAIKKLKEFVFQDQLYVAFMQKGKVSETYPVTDYVLENYFVADHSPKMLLRSIVTKLDEIQSAEVKNEVFIVFSDGQIYNADKPLDPKHFEYQKMLLNKCKQIEDLQFFYVNINEDTGSEFATVNDVENLFTYVCQQTGGVYIPKLDLNIIADNTALGKNNEDVDYSLNLQNPDNKIYRGDKRILNVSCVCGDSILYTGSTVYSLGSIYKPVIVNGYGVGEILIQSVVFTLILLLFVYVIFQFLVPYIKYKVFEYKYVTKYTGPNMSYNGILVPEVCYYCKTPFEIGDEIVVKCEHVMHKSCWNENLYKCPEYGRNCILGKHYYNEKNVFDTQNAPYYMKWLLSGVLAGFVAWIFFILGIFHSDLPLVQSIFDIVSRIDPLKEISTHLNGEDTRVFAAPYFGFFICSCVTLFLSILSSHGKWLFKRAAIVIAKSVVAGICGYLSYFLIVLVILSFNFKGYYYYIMDCIPWALNGYMIAYIVSFKTDIKLKKALRSATVSIIFAIISMHIWNYSSFSHVDSRDLLFISSLIYSIGLSFSLAINYPHSERYFLKVEGPIKTMEIALYKWINAQTMNRCVTIGKSVDCTLQMSWDINSSIAPKQAEVKNINGDIYLIPLEDGVVFKNKPATIDRKIRLYHGDHFIIGQTRFTYIEHDV